DHLLHLATAEQLAEPLAVDPGIVAGDGEMPDPGRLDRVDQPLRNAAQAKPARADRHAVEQQALQCGGGVGIDLLHARAPWISSGLGGAGESGQAKLNEVSTLPDSFDLLVDRCSLDRYFVFQSCLEKLNGLATRHRRHRLYPPAFRER